MITLFSNLESSSKRIQGTDNRQDFVRKSAFGDLKNTLAVNPVTPLGKPLLGNPKLKSNFISKPLSIPKAIINSSILCTPQHSTSKKLSTEPIEQPLKTIDAERKWAEKLVLNDEEINRLVYGPFSYADKYGSSPPPPPPTTPTHILDIDVEFPIPDIELDVPDLDWTLPQMNDGATGNPNDHQFFDMSEFYMSLATNDNTDIYF